MKSKNLCYILMETKYRKCWRQANNNFDDLKKILCLLLIILSETFEEILRHLNA